MLFIYGKKKCIGEIYTCMYDTVIRYLNKVVLWLIVFGELKNFSKRNKWFLLLEVNNLKREFFFWDREKISGKSKEENNFCCKRDFH